MKYLSVSKEQTRYEAEREYLEDLNEFRDWLKTATPNEKFAIKLAMNFLAANKYAKKNEW